MADLAHIILSFLAYIMIDDIGKSRTLKAMSVATRIYFLPPETLHWLWCICPGLCPMKGHMVNTLEHQVLMDSIYDCLLHKNGHRSSVGT